MSDDRIMADLLGDAPRTPDPGFRIDVFARISERARRREAFAHAAMQVAVFSALGLIVPVAQAAGLTQESLMPVLGVLGALALAGLFAWTTIQGPRAVLARTRAALRLG